MLFLFDAIAYSDSKCVLYFVKVNIMFCVEIKTFPRILFPCVSYMKWRLPTYLQACKIYSQKYSFKCFCFPFKNPLPGNPNAIYTN